MESPIRNKSFWLNYDLGLRGNFSGLFTFLDNNNAIECGDGLAYFTYDNKDLLNIETLIEKIKNELIDLISPTSTDRVYIIWKEGLKVNGRFILGKRKSAPWTGYGNKGINEQNEEAI